jgi:hypothetical protein
MGVDHAWQRPGVPVDQRQLDTGPTPGARCLDPEQSGADDDDVAQVWVPLGRRTRGERIVEASQQMHSGQRQALDRWRPQSGTRGQDEAGEAQPSAAAAEGDLVGGQVQRDGAGVQGSGDPVLGEPLIGKPTKVRLAAEEVNLAGGMQPPDLGGGGEPGDPAADDDDAGDGGVDVHRLRDGRRRLRRHDPGDPAAARLGGHPRLAPDADPATRGSGEPQVRHGTGHRHRDQHRERGQQLAAGHERREQRSRHRSQRARREQPPRRRTRWCGGLDRSQDDRPTPERAGRSARGPGTPDSPRRTCRC